MIGWAGRVLAGLYVGVVAVLAADAFSGRDATFSWAEGAAMLLTLPAVIPAVPVMYVLGAGIWNITNADSGGPMWPVTLVYALMFVGVAIANLGGLRWALRRWRRHRLGHPGQPQSTA